jgi:sodium/pantothenate symporter
LVGVCTLALPQSIVRSISYKDTKALSNAMIIGTIMIGAITLVATWIGVLSKGILTNPSIAAYGGSVDNITPRTIVACMSPFMAGITIIGPIAATISTISSLLLTGSSSIIKDIYMNVQEKKGKTVTNNEVKNLSMACTLIMGLAVFFISIVPPDLIWKINMFAFGGLETAFLWVMVFGVFWKKANRTGALWCLIGGVISYCGSMALGIKIFNLHQIVIGMGVSLILFLIGNSMGEPSDEKTLRTFFPDQYND